MYLVLDAMKVTFSQEPPDAVYEKSDAKFVPPTSDCVVIWPPLMA